MNLHEKLFERLASSSEFFNFADLCQEYHLSKKSLLTAITKLEKRGLVFTYKGQSIRLEKQDLLLPEKIAQKTGLTVRFLAHNQSTKEAAKEGIRNGDSAKTLYLAPSQNNAKGRFGRSFFAAENGGIYMTLRLSPNVSFDELKPYTLLLASSCVIAIKKQTGIDTDIKWVNDIYYQNKKLAGILTEVVLDPDSQLISDLTISLGLNFMIEAFPKNLSDHVISLFQDSPTTTRNDLIIEIWKTFFQYSEKELIDCYKKSSLVLGKRVSFKQNNHYYEGVANHLSDKGELTVLLDNQTSKTLQSGEVSLLTWH